jgi:hypothetical protein
MYEDGSFRVVSASDGEKGPFQTLANGKLQRGEPLTMTLRMDDSSLCTITFETWSTHASTDLSPSAGWGVSQNSVQFFSNRNQVLILLSLADTGPGRGWDSVGHARGRYRNLMTFSTPKP